MIKCVYMQEGDVFPYEDLDKYRKFYHRNPFKTYCTWRMFCYWDIILHIIYPASKECRANIGPTAIRRIAVDPKLARFFVLAGYQSLILK